MASRLIFPRRSGYSLMHALLSVMIYMRLNSHLLLFFSINSSIPPSCRRACNALLSIVIEILTQLCILHSRLHFSVRSERFHKSRYEKDHEIARTLASCIKFIGLMHLLTIW